LVFGANDIRLYLLAQGVLADAEGDELGDGDGLNNAVGKPEPDKSLGLSLGLSEADGLSSALGLADSSARVGLIDALLLGVGVGMGIIV